MTGIAVIDIIFIVLAIILTIRCALRGFIGELMSMASVVLGLLAALFFYKNGGAFIREKFLPGMKIFPEVLAFIALFLIVFIVIKILEGILKDIIERIRLGGADRFLGVIFGLVEGVIVISLILFVLTIQPLFDPAPILRESFFAELLLPLITGREQAAAFTALFRFLPGSYV
ncbi:MAG: CvpA family protein [Treponema sp.]|jgi:membrane protein required for colicin V production|nr:CvpA family protein [Treponema sp.]